MQKLQNFLDDPLHQVPGKHRDSRKCYAPCFQSGRNPSKIHTLAPNLDKKSVRSDCASLLHTHHADCCCTNARSVAQCPFGACAARSCHSADAASSYLPRSSNRGCPASTPRFRSTSMARPKEPEAPMKSVLASNLNVQEFCTGFWGYT